MCRVYRIPVYMRAVHLGITLSLWSIKCIVYNHVQYTMNCLACMIIYNTLCIKIMQLFDDVCNMTFPYLRQR